MAVMDRVKSAWNAFRSTSEAPLSDLGMQSYSYGGESPSRPRRRYSNERTIIASIYNRISIDVSAVLIRHINIDQTNRYVEDVASELNNCLTLEANIDQAPRAFRQDIAMTLFDKGVAVLVPTDTTVNPDTNEVVDIYSLRVGEVVAWYPSHVQVSVYNETSGKRQTITLPKRFVAIIENPLYSVINETNSTLQRLIRKLSLLDVVDEQSSSGKLDLIIQLPYVIKSEARRQQAEKRREDIEFQLKGSQYGIAYTDGTEKITQLNRPVENNLLAQIEYLTHMLYGQLGLTEEVMNGSAKEEALVNYNTRTIEPIIDAIIEAMQRSFLGPVRTKKGERIKFFIDPFRLVPVTKISELVDKFSRNEILTGNEIREIIGYKPSSDPRADELRNSNLRVPTSEPPVVPTAASTSGVVNKSTPVSNTTPTVTPSKASTTSNTNPASPKAPGV